MVVLFSTLIQDLQNLIKLGSKEVERCDDPTIGSKLVLPHHFFVVDSVLLTIAIVRSVGWCGCVENVQCSCSV